jgi:hypothetical protein
MRAYQCRVEDQAGKRQAPQRITKITRNVQETLGIRPHPMIVGTTELSPTRMSSRSPSVWNRTQGLLGRRRRA